MLNKQRILLLSLYTFDITGGVEKVCRAVTKALSDFKENEAIGDYKCMSMYDTLADQRYISAENFTGFDGNRFGFGLEFIKQSSKSEIIILSHINLLIFGWLVKKIKPKSRIILFAHGIEIWKSLHNWKKKFLKNKVEIWAVSHYTASKINSQHGIPSNTIRILNNCLDPFFDVPETFQKPLELIERYGLSDDKKILFTLTRLSSDEKYKGYDQVLAVMKKLPGNIHYILAGKADEAERERVDALIAEYKLQQRVTVTGFLADEEITGHFLLADVFVMPSKAEGFGISFIEASACGCKVIAGNQDGSADALLNGEMGALINPSSFDELEYAINTALERPSTPLQQQEKTLANFGFQGYKEKLLQLLTH